MAKYEVEQYVYKGEGASFLTSLAISSSIWKSSLSESSTATSTTFTFKDTCFSPNEGVFKKNNSYYFHGYVKKMAITEQVLFIKLGRRTDEEQFKDYQYIKKITVSPSLIGNQWQEISFTFTPVEDFNCIIFQLQRTEEDFIHGERESIIICSEISLIKNIDSIIQDTRHVIKLGIQARPGFKMCINSEEIIIGPTRVFEIDKDIIEIVFVSALAPLQLLIDDFSIFDKSTVLLREEDRKEPGQEAQVSNIRLFDDFIIDYMYYL